MTSSGYQRRLYSNTTTTTTTTTTTRSTQDGLPAENGYIEELSNGIIETEKMEVKVEVPESEAEKHKRTSEGEGPLVREVQEDDDYINSNDCLDINTRSFNSVEGTPSDTNTKPEDKTEMMNGCIKDDFQLELEETVLSRLDPVKVHTEPNRDISKHECGLDLRQSSVQTPEETPRQASCIEVATVSVNELISQSSARNAFNLEDSWLNKRPIPSLEPAKDREQDEFEFGFETTVLPRPKEVNQASFYEYSGSCGGLQEIHQVSVESREDTNTVDGPLGSSNVVAGLESFKRTTRTRVLSDCSTRVTEPPVTETASNKLHSRSLTNVTLGFAYDLTHISPRPDKTSSSPPSSRYWTTTGRTGTGQLNREKKAARTLRRISWDADGVRNRVLCSRKVLFQDKMLIHQSKFIPFHSFIHSFIHSFNQSFNHSAFIHSFIHPSILFVPGGT